MDKARLREVLAELGTDQEQTTRALLDMLEEQYGFVPLVMKVLARRPDACIPSALKTRSVLTNSKVLDSKTNELLAVAAATSLRCEHCLLVHTEQALNSGATREEVFQAILVASLIAESSSWAVSFRVLNRVEEKLAKQRGETGPHG